MIFVRNRRSSADKDVCEAVCEAVCRKAAWGPRAKCKPKGGQSQAKMGAICKADAKLTIAAPGCNYHRQTYIDWSTQADSK